MKMLYLDESGDHQTKKINPNMPLFILGGVVVDRLYAREVINPVMREFKRQLFSNEHVVLHTVEMRNNSGEFSFLTNPELRRNFYSNLNSLLEGLDFSVIAVVIRKEEFQAANADKVGDLYLYALKLLVERFCIALQADNDDGFICAESRSAAHDRELRVSWEALRTGDGAGAATSEMIEDHIVGLESRDKRSNLAAMQLADLVLTPISRFILQRPEKEDQVQWEMVERKLRRANGEYLGTGLVVKP